MPITYGTYGPLTSVTLENEYVRAVILPSKGADIIEFIHKGSGINALYRSDLPASAYNETDLSQKRLSFHSEKLLGGYMDVLPHRGCYQGRILEQEEGGIAATLPWKMEVIEDTTAVMRIKCDVLLPVFPLYVERIYTLAAGAKTLHIEEYIRNTAAEPMEFTWTQHALFGGELLKGNVRIELPCDTLFKAWEHARYPDRELADFFSEPNNVRLRQGVFDLTKAPDERCADYEFVVFKELREGRASIINADLELGIDIQWDIRRLSYLRAVYRCGSDGPMMGLEPSDDMFSGWEHSVRHHTCTVLAGGEELRTWFTLGFS